MGVSESQDRFSARPFGAGGVLDARCLVLEARDDAGHVQDVHVEDDDQREERVVLEVDRRRERVLLGGECLELLLHLRPSDLGRQLRQRRHVDDLELLREFEAVLDGRLAVGVDDALVLCGT